MSVGNGAKEAKFSLCRTAYACSRLAEGTDLSEALARKSRYPDQVLGLVTGSKGLGVRILKGSFEDTAGKLFTAETAQREIRVTAQRRRSTR